MKSVAASALAAAIEAAAGQDPAAPIDADADPLTVLRALLASATSTIASLPPSSPRMNPARAEARALTKAIAGLERERAAKETPEEQERRLRREDGETLREILWAVEKAEQEAAARGACTHCGLPLARMAG